MNLAGKYLEIWNLAKPYLAKCRRWDLWHTEMSVDFMHQIIKGENAENLENILIPTIILHDIGWAQIGDEKNVSWGEKDMRIQHMQEGSKIAKSILAKVDYNNKLTTKICNLVSTHDNYYLGKSQNSLEEKLVRDADACFVLTDLSFWKDYHVTTVDKGVKMTPKRFLNKQVAKNSQRNTKTAQNITNQQITERLGEIKDKSRTPEQRYIELNKEAEKRNKEALKQG